MALEDRVVEAKNDDHILNDLISEYKPFIQKTVYETCQRYVEWGKDEELSIGLLAFEESVKRFDPNRGSFLSLTKKIIRSRVIDFLRKENRHHHADIENIKEELIEDHYGQSLSEEIDELQAYLSKYHISFQNLVEISPVKKTLREELKYAAKIMAKSSNCMNHFFEKGQLPIQAIAKKTGISYKKIERNRIYFITMVLIWYLELPLLQGYLK